MKEYSIAILGLGGVGGYLGGKLAAAHLPGVRIIFIARGETLEVLRRDGLTLITETEEVTVRSDLASDDPEAIGPVDLLVCTVKGYDLGASLLKYKGCLTAGTVILPLLNGIGIGEKIRKILPGALVWEGLIYLVARQISKGVVRQTGALREIIFGSPAGQTKAMQEVAGMMTAAGLKATVSDNIELEIWRKFIFISVMGTLTSYYHSAIGPIRKDPAKAAHIPGLLGELKAVAIANGIPITEALAGAILERIEHLPSGTTTSMSADFQKGGRTELEEQTGDVVRLGQRSGVPTPIYETMYKGLADR